MNVHTDTSNIIPRGDVAWLAVGNILEQEPHACFFSPV